TKPHRSGADDDHTVGGVVHLRIMERATNSVRSLPPCEEQTEPASRMCASRTISILRGHHVLHGADPAGVGEVEYDAERILVLGLGGGARGAAGTRRRGPAGKILPARPHPLLLRFVEILTPHPEVVDAALLAPSLLDQRDVDGAAGAVEPAPGLARHFHVEG